MIDDRHTQMAVSRMAAPAGQRAGVAPETITPKEVLAILRRHIWLIVSLTTAGLILGGVAWKLLSMYAPKYRAETVIRVLPAIEKDPRDIVSTQPSKDIQYWKRVSTANLIKQQNTLQELVNRDVIQETGWFLSKGETKDEKIAKAVKDLKKNFGASPQREGDFVVISMTCGSRKESALIVNEMLDMFLTQQGGQTRSEIAERLARLDEQRRLLERDLDAAERSLDEVRSSWGFTDLEQYSFRHTVTERLAKLNEDEQELGLLISQIETSIETLRQQATGPINVVVEHEIETDPIMLQLRQQSLMYEAQLESMLTRFGESHTSIVQTKELIAATERKREERRAVIGEQTRQSNLQNARDQLTAYTSRAEELKKRRDAAVKEQRDLENARVQYERRVDIRDERRLRVEETKSAIEQLKAVREDPETPKLQRVAPAPQPLEISSPKWQVFFPAGTMLGMMLGVGLAFAIELLSDLVRTPKDVTKYLRIPLLGVVPDAREDGDLEDIELSHVVRLAPYSSMSESYRRFRTNLKLGDSTEHSRVLLISSGMSGDGKTSVAANLASSLVAEGKKVLIVDANFWRPNLHKVFPNGNSIENNSAAPEYGLSNLLMGQCEYGDVIESAGVDGLSVLKAGHLPSNPAELLGGARMAELIRTQRDRFDYIIIDGPPVLLVSDVKMLARLVDGTILVFSAAATKRGAAQRAIRELRQVNANIAGCVLFAVKALKGGYFHEQFKYHQEYQKAHLAGAAN